MIKTGQKNMKLNVVFSYLRNCQVCFIEETKKVKQLYRCVPYAKRFELCERFGYTCQWTEFGSKRVGDTEIELSEPARKPAKGTLAEVGGECFFSSIYYLLVGKKSGNHYHELYNQYRLSM